MGECGNKTRAEITDEIECFEYTETSLKFIELLESTNQVKDAI